MVAAGGGLSGALVVELVPHMLPVNRTDWPGADMDRPLTEQGQAQAAALAAALVRPPVDALYSSPFRRCRQTLKPLAERTGQSIVTVDALGETGDADEATQAARVITAVQALVKQHASGRVIVCSHGFMMDPAVQQLAQGLGVALSRNPNGGWYTLTFRGDELIDAQTNDLPQVT